MGWHHNAEPGVLKLLWRLELVLQQVTSWGTRLRQKHDVFFWPFPWIALDSLQPYQMAALAWKSTSVLRFSDQNIFIRLAIYTEKDMHLRYVVFLNQLKSATSWGGLKFPSSKQPIFCTGFMTLGSLTRYRESVSATTFVPFLSDLFQCRIPVKGGSCVIVCR